MRVLQAFLDNPAFWIKAFLLRLGEPSTSNNVIQQNYREAKFNHVFGLSSYLHYLIEYASNRARILNGSKQLDKSKDFYDSIYSREPG